MAREVEFDDQNIFLRLSGATALLALKTHLKIPFNTIKSIYVDDFDAPLWMLRMPGTSFSTLNIFEGSFKYANEWYFLSYENKESLIVIELEGHDKYNHVVFQIDNPTIVASEIHRRLTG